MTTEIVTYPIIVTAAGEGVHVTIPDIAGGETQGEDFVDGVNRAMLLIGQVLSRQPHLPTPSKLNELTLPEHGQAVYVAVDLTMYRQRFPVKVAVPVELPAYLVEASAAHNLDLDKFTTAVLAARLDM